ncbi:MAG: glycosyltransferase family 4 protein, partial [Planctomycetales bacterium]|nr:glycosyltransferase family 4 protein [Planctomycetales bacterium]
SLVLAASEYSKSGLIDLGVPESKIRLVPYALRTDYFSKPPSPVRGRVLFVGTVGYLKGIPDLAAAARALKKSHPDIEVRVVGPFELDVANCRDFDGPTYLGQMPRNEVKSEYLNADLFVFPTISDAFGIVLMEALAAGLPIVASPNCADAVDHGVNGLRVPIHDPQAVADAVARIVENRDMRAAMSVASKRKLDYFSPQAYRDRMSRVVAALRESR